MRTCSIVHGHEGPWDCVLRPENRRPGVGWMGCGVVPPGVPSAAKSRRETKISWRPRPAQRHFRIPACNYVENLPRGAKTPTIVKVLAESVGPPHAGSWLSGPRPAPLDEHSWGPQGGPLSSRPPAVLQGGTRLAGVPMFPCSLKKYDLRTKTDWGQRSSVTKGGPFGRGTGDQGNRRGKGPEVGPGRSQRRARPDLREWGWPMAGRTMGCAQPRCDRAHRRCRLPVRAPSLPASLGALPRQDLPGRSPPIRISFRGRVDGNDVRRGLSGRMTDCFECVPLIAERRIDRPRLEGRTRASRCPGYRGRARPAPAAGLIADPARGARACPPAGQLVQCRPGNAQ